MIHNKKIENRMIENPSFWVIIISFSITLLFIIIRYGWEIAEDSYINDLWHFGLGIFFAAFFTAALTYVGILFQGKVQKDLQIQQLNNNYIQELSKERKIQLFEELLNLAIDFEYKEESLDDYKNIEVILFKIRMYCNDTTIAAAQKMIDVVTKTAHGVGKQEIEDFVLACNKELYFKYNEDEQEELNLKKFSEFLLDIQKRILKVDKNIVFIELPAYENREFLWCLARFHSEVVVFKEKDVLKISAEFQSNFKQELETIPEIKIGSILTFYIIYHCGKTIPAIVGIAKVSETKGNLISLDWIVSTNIPNRIKLNYERYNLHIPNIHKNSIQNSEIKPENLQFLYDVETQLNYKNKQKLEILENKEFSGKKENEYIILENASEAIEFFLIVLQTQGSVLIQFDGIECNYEGKSSDKEIIEIKIEKSEGSNKPNILKIFNTDIPQGNYKIKLSSKLDKRKEKKEYYLEIQNLKK